MSFRMLFNRLMYGRTLDRPGAGGETCLTRALKMNDDVSVSEFLALGANPDRKNAAGEYPVHVALDRKNLQAAQLLLEVGADFLIKKDGLGLGEYATKNGLPIAAEVVKRREEALKKAQGNVQGILPWTKHQPKKGPAPE